MTMPRRTFLRDAFRSTLSVGILIAAGRASFAQQGTSSGVPLDAQKDPVFSFVAATFEPYVGDIFTTPNARGEAIELKLIKLQQSEPKNTVTKLARSTKSFSLQFKASDELPPFTSIYTISHPRLGKFDLFLTRRKTDAGDLFYEAVINHVE
jgi:phage/plasmid-associated DNA primase